MPNNLIAGNRSLTDGYRKYLARKHFRGVFKFILKEKWFAKKPGFKQLKISLFAYLPTRKLAYFKYNSQDYSNRSELASRTEFLQYLVLEAA